MPEVRVQIIRNLVCWSVILLPTCRTQGEKTEKLCPEPRTDLLTGFVSSHIWRNPSCGIAGTGKSLSACRRFYAGCTQGIQKFSCPRFLPEISRAESGPSSIKFGDGESSETSRAESGGWSCHVIRGGIGTGETDP